MFGKRNNLKPDNNSRIRQLHVQYMPKKEEEVTITLLPTR